MIVEELPHSSSPHSHCCFISLDQSFSTAAIWLSGNFWHIWRGPQTWWSIIDCISLMKRYSTVYYWKVLNALQDTFLLLTSKQTSIQLWCKNRKHQNVHGLLLRMAGLILQYGVGKLWSVGLLWPPRFPIQPEGSPQSLMNFWSIGECWELVLACNCLLWHP